MISIKKFFHLLKKNKAEEKPDYLVAEIMEAKMDWLYSLDSYNYVVDPMLIDYCIYRILACEKRYSYLLRLAKKENIKAYNPILSR